MSETISTIDEQNLVLVALEAIPFDEQDRILNLRREFVDSVYGCLLEGQTESLNAREINQAAHNTLTAYPLLKGLGQKELAAMNGLVAHLNGELSTSIGQRQRRPSFSIELERKQLTRNMTVAFKHLGEVSLQKLLEAPEVLGARKEYISESQGKVICGASGITLGTEVRKEEAAQILAVFSAIFEKVMQGVPNADIPAALSRLRRLADGKSIADIALEDGVHTNAIYVTRDRYFSALQRAVGADTLRQIVEARGEVDPEAMVVKYLSARVQRLRDAEELIKHLDEEAANREIAFAQESEQISPQQARSIKGIRTTESKTVVRKQVRQFEDADWVIGSYEPLNPEKAHYTPAQLRLMEQNKGLVHHIVNAMRLPADKRQDAFQVGFMGLMEAAQRFVPEKDVRFGAFAQKRVHGAILDMLREEDFLPRSVRAAMVKVKALEDRQLPDEDICTVLEMSPEKLAQLRLDAARGIVYSFEGLAAQVENAELLNVKAVENGYSQIENTVYEDQINGIQGRVEEILRASQVSSRNIEIFWLYIKGMTLSDIGVVYGMTESRICQIYGKVSGILRHYFKDSSEREDIYSLLVA
jgi:RNA polymerase sigma factor for flagellar operon FliA